MASGQTSRWGILLCLIILANGASCLMLPQDSLLPTLDRLAAAGTSQENMEAYSQAIIRLASVDKLHEPFASALTKRFTQNESRVRTGKQARVSELAVSMAFNRIAEIVGAPPRVNVDTVHAFRKLLEPSAPHLITLSIAPDSCNPGEAIVLIYIMIANNGTLQEVTSNETRPSPPESVRVTVRPEQQPPGMKVLVAKFVAGKQDVDLLRRLESVLSLLRL